MTDLNQNNETIIPLDEHMELGFYLQVINDELAKQAKYIDLDKLDDFCNLASHHIFTLNCYHERAVNQSEGYYFAKTLYELNNAFSDEIQSQISNRIEGEKIKLTTLRNLASRLYQMAYKTLIATLDEVTAIQPLFN